jgi:hypothetical protein
MMDAVLHVTIEQHGASISVVCGGVQLYLARVAERYHVNGGRRPRNLAVYVGTPNMGAYVTVEVALELWERLGLPLGVLRDELKRQGWMDGLVNGQLGMFEEVGSG